MSDPNRLSKDHCTPKTLSDDNSGRDSGEYPSELSAMSICGGLNALPDQQSSSLKVSINSKSLSSPSVPALAKQITVNKLMDRENTPEASVSYGSINSHRGHPTHSTITKQRVTAVKRSRSTSVGPLFPSPRSPLVRIKRSKGPVRRKRATPTKSSQQNHRQLLLDNLTDVEPFEKIAALEVELRLSSQSPKFSHDLRRLQSAVSIHRSVKTSLARQSLTHQDRFTQQNPVLDIKDLGLGHLVVVKDQESCSFCMFECNYGSSNENILLPASASYHKCLDCLPTSLFDEAYEHAEPPQKPPASSLEQVKILPPGTHTVSKHRIYVKLLSGVHLTIEVGILDTVLEVKSQLSRYDNIDWGLHHLVSEGAVLQDNRPLSQYRIGPRSLIEIVELKRFNGVDITQYWKPTFCSGCPWTQVDVKLAKLCLSCAEEKYAIIKHSRHGAWGAFFHTLQIAEGTPKPGHRQGNCMICTSLAKMKCGGCPLLVCVNCSTHLDGRCKGSLNILLYSFSQEHIRNDAFLLRSDGGGF